jgi:CheY-like chemotaxis protein
MSDQPILIVEDEPDGRELVSRLLAVVNIPFEVAVDGEDAWDKLQTRPYSLAIIDLALPGMDGIELLRKIRADQALSGLPCLAITAFHTPELKQRAIAEGFNTYLPKPIDRTILLGALDNLRR